MKLDISSLGNAIVDVQFSIEEDFVSKLEKMSIPKGSMTLIEAEEQSNLIKLLMEEYGNSKLSCGGAATNSIVAASNFGSKCHFSCRVKNDDLGIFYLEDLVGTFAPQVARLKSSFHGKSDTVSGTVEKVSSKTKRCAAPKSGELYARLGKLSIAGP